MRNGRPFAEIRGGSLFGDFGGRGWEWVANFIALGGLYLLYAGTIRWHIPDDVSRRGLARAGDGALSLDPNGFATPGFHLFSGSTMLSAFFIATEPLSAAGTDLRAPHLGAGIGMLVYAIRTWGTIPRRRGVLGAAHERARSRSSTVTAAANLWPALRDPLMTGVVVAAFAVAAFYGVDAAHSGVRAHRGKRARASSPGSIACSSRGCAAAISRLLRSPHGRHPLWKR